MYVTDIYTQSVRMPTYLVAFMFSEFESVEDSTDSGTTVRLTNEIALYSWYLVG